MKKLNHKNTASRQFLFLYSFDVGKVTKGMPNAGRIFFTKNGQFLSFSLNLAFPVFFLSFPLLSPRRHRFLQKTLIPSLRINGGWSEEDGNSQEDGRIE